jgi:glycosyltransferase involved in cell wall biosynthesis
MSRVSVAMCTYNGAQFLSQQLASLAQQSWQPDELVVCDDRSADSSIFIVKEFAKTAPFKVSLYENERNLGYVQNFEQAIQRCSGDIVFLCDQDDVWHPDKIKRCVAAFESQPDVGLVLHGFNWVDDQGQAFSGPIERYGDEGLTAAELPQTFERSSIEVFMSPYPRAWCGCMMAFRSLFVGDIVPIFPGKGHDDWILKLLAAISHVRFLDEALIDYRIHSTNVNGRDISRRTLGYRWNRFLYKAVRVVKGYSKRGFYAHLLGRLALSKHNVLYPDLVKKYRRHAKWF